MAAKGFSLRSQRALKSLRAFSMYSSLFESRYHPYKKAFVVSQVLRSKQYPLSTIYKFNKQFF